MSKDARNHLNSGALVALFIAVCAWPLAAAQPASADDAAGAGAEAAAAPSVDAQALWNKNCKSCHGEDGKGQTKAGKMKKVEDLTDAAVREKSDRAAMIKSVTEGINDESGKPRMKGYGEKLSAEEIAALVDYVRALPH
jgi:cytochrome c5